MTKKNEDLDSYGCQILLWTYGSPIAVGALFAILDGQGVFDSMSEESKGLMIAFSVVGAFILGMVGSALYKPVSEAISEKFSAQKID